MAFTPTSPVTGSAQTGLTSPTFTLAADQAPDSNGKQWLVSALGGTQPGVIPHNVAAPFTVTIYKPRQFKTLRTVNGGAGTVSEGSNTWTVLVRKHVYAGSAALRDRTAQVKLQFILPAGSEWLDESELRALLSATFGFLSGNSSALGDCLISGSL